MTERKSSEEKPTGLTVLAWSTAIAVFTAIATCAGMARADGKRSALALYGLARPGLDQRDTIVGMISILQASLLTLSMFAIGWILYRIARWALRGIKAEERMRALLLQRTGILYGAALALFLGDICFLNFNIFRLQSQAAGIILKSSSETGKVWKQVLLENAAGRYHLVFGAAAAVFLALAVWCISKTKKPWPRIAFSFWAGAEALFLLLGFSYLLGVTDTLEEFPLVAFSGGQQLPHATYLLLGSDDKEFAFLAVNLDTKPGELPRYILYEPRSEVKWMVAGKMEPFQGMARLDELRNLAH